MYTDVKIEDRKRTQNARAFVYIMRKTVIGHRRGQNSAIYRLDTDGDWVGERIFRTVSYRQHTSLERCRH